MADRDGWMDLHAMELSERSARADGGPATISSRDSPGVSDGASQAGPLRLHQEVCLTERDPAAAASGMD